MNGSNSYPTLQGKSQSFNGYYYSALATDQDGEPYGQDPDKDGNPWTNNSRFAVCAYPAVYGATGRMTFLINEAGKTFKTDTGGQTVEAWPGKDPAEQGWIPAD
jgi:hypothetical protein